MEADGTNLSDTMQYTCPGLNCTITNVQPNYPWIAFNPNPSACIFTYPNGTTCFFEGINKGSIPDAVQMYRFCSNDWNWTPVGSATSDVVDFWRSSICDPARGFIVYLSDGIIQIFNITSLTWISGQSPGVNVINIFLHLIFAKKFCCQNFKPKSQLHSFFAPIICTKNVAKKG
jgi:hypothetical protein